MLLLEKSLCTSGNLAFLILLIATAVPNQSFGSEKLKTFSAFDENSLRNNEQLEKALVKNLAFRDGRTEIPSNPDEVETTLELHKDYACDIDPSSKKCKSFTETLRVIKKTEINPLCPSAAAEYLKYYKADSFWVAPPHVTAKYDSSCLDSISHRKDDSSINHALSDTFRINYFFEMVKYNVGLLEVDDNPICGGLIHKRKKFITSAHCYLEYLSYFKDGRVKVRSISGDSIPWPVLSPSSISSGADLTKVKNDWAVFDLQIDNLENIKETVFEPPPQGTVSLLGYFSGHKHSEYHSPHEPAWKQGLRAPKNGTCNVLISLSGCVHLACQTVPGFSGAPIFKRTLSSDGNLSVIGFVSREYRASAGCGSGFDFTTLATSALEIKL